MMPTRGLIFLVILSVLAIAVFGLAPQIDLLVSRLFFSVDDGFALGRHPVLGAFQRLLQAIIFATPLALAVAAIATAIRRPVFDVPLRLWLFLLANYVVVAGLLANVLIKGMWGRFRPDAISEFGGDGTFTTILQPFGPCLTDCSFVSGEASAATAFGIAVVMLVPYLARDARRNLWRTIGLAIPGCAILLRVATGRHYVSDVVFAVLFVLIVAMLLAPLILRGDPRAAR